MSREQIKADGSQEGRDPGLSIRGTQGGVKLLQGPSEPHPLPGPSSGRASSLSGRTGAAGNVTDLPNVSRSVNPNLLP